MKDLLRYSVYLSVFAVLFIPIFVSGSMFFPYITGKNFAFRILVEIALASWVLLAFWDAQYRPKFSWIAVSGAALLVVMFFANLFGEYAPKSFWSNYERMDGYVTLVHFYFYFLVLGSVLQGKLWNYFLRTSIAVASYVALFGLLQSGSMGGRVDSTLGNAAYMAVYMLFNIFILLFLSLRSRNWYWRGLYGLVSLMFVYVLLVTGTRGTFIGLAVGGLVTVTYLAIFGRRHSEVRRFAALGLVALVLAGGLFYIARDSNFVQQNAALSRIANISIEKDLVIRSTIWGMAWEGVKERPVLGWGQSNFDYVFNKQYSPAMHGQEAWFDRVHNIFFDWLIAGGVLGFLAYFSILFSAIYYLFWRPIFRPDEDDFTVFERAALMGILAGYFTHNLVVFDNIVSYIFYAIILALIHSRVATESPRLQKIKVDQQILVSMIAPITITVLVCTIYFVNIPSILAARDIIDAFRAQDIALRLEKFQSAFRRGSFADQEINEQLVSQVATMINDPNISDAEKTKYARIIESEFKKMISRKPGDARLHVILANFYRQINNPKLALEQLKIARELSPNKPQIVLEQAFATLQAEDNQGALAYFKEAYNLGPQFMDLRAYYVAGALFAGEDNVVNELANIEELKNNEALRRAFIEPDLLISAANIAKRYDLLIYLLEERVKARPNDVKEVTNLAMAYYQAGNSFKAISILEQVKINFPERKGQVDDLIKQLQAENK